MFLIAGGTRLAGAEMHIAMFEKIGLGQGFRYFTGGLELISALLLLVPKTAAIATALLAATMVGAIVTHLFIINGSAVVPIVLLLITLAVAWYRRHVSVSGEKRGMNMLKIAIVTGSMRPGRNNEA
jgi:putative oxidoreductase